MEVSVIIVNYNTRLMLKDCIDSVIMQTKDIQYEIIIVDNNSTNDDSVQYLESMDGIKTIFLKDNIGFGRANNEGLKVAEGEYVFFLNSDTILRNNAIKQLYEFAQRYEGRLGGLGTILEDTEGNPIHSYGQFPRMRDDWNKLIVVPFKKLLGIYTQPDIKYPQHSMSVDYITGADLFVHRNVLEECGTFSPEFFMYYEETEMQWRFRSAGYTNVLMSGPRIIHLEGGGTKNSSVSKFIRDCVRQQKSEYIYYRLTRPVWKYYIYRIVHPLLRQTMWLNPNVSFADKMTLMKQLF